MTRTVQAEAIELTLSRATNSAIQSEMERDSSVVCWGEDIAGGAGVTWFPDDEDAWPGVQPAYAGLRAKFGADRVKDMPIAEAGFIGAAFGAASLGLRPIVDLWYPDFLGVCLDQVTNQGAKTPYMFGNQWTVPVVIRTLIGAGRSFGAQHSGCHYSVLAHYPGIKVVAPSTPHDAKGLMISAIRDDNPVIYCEHKLLTARKGSVPTKCYTIPIGQADLKRQGTDILIVTVSAACYTALQAADELSKEGIEAAVLDLRSLSPLDEDSILENLGRIGRMVILDEDLPRCGIASEVAAIAAGEGFRFLRAPVERVMPPPVPVPFSPTLEKAYMPDVARTVSAVRRVLAAS